MSARAPKRIVLVGGDATIRELLLTATSSVSAEIIEVSDNLECLDHARTRRCQLIVTDIRSKGTDDVELLKQIRMIRPDAKVLVMVPESYPENVIDAIREHAFGYFSSPVSRTAFISLVTEALGIQAWHDGIEVLSARPEWITLRARCRMVTADRLVQFMRELKMDIDEKERDNVTTAFREMLLNALEHGAGFDPDKTVEITYIRTDRVIVYQIRDPGEGFSFNALPHAAISNPTNDPIAHIVLRNEQGLRPGGFGIMISQGLVDDLFYNEKGNEAVLIKYLP